MNQPLMNADKALDVNLHGYRLTKVKEAQGRETNMFSATITLNGKAVLEVSNDGNGGCNRYNGVGTDYRGQAQIDALTTAAKAWAEDVDYLYKDSFEIEDSFVDHLLTLADFARKRAVAFMFGDANPFADGRFYLAPAKVTVDQVKAQFASNPAKYAGARIFDKNAYAFIPAI